MASHHIKKSRWASILRLNIPILLCVCAQFSHADDAKAALETLRTWMNNNLRVSEETTPLSSETSGVCVILRRNGILLGYGEAFGETENLLSEATTIAFKKVRKHPNVLKLPESVREHAFSLISIEVGVAGKCTPLPTKNIDKAAKKILQGVDAIAVRRGKKWDFRMPSQMRLSPNRKITNHLEGMCIKVGAPAVESIAHQFSNDEDITMYKVDFTSVYQQASGEKIQLLYRGDELITTSHLQQTGLQGVADLLASHLIHSLWPSKEAIGITGTYKPEVDRFDNIFAPLIPQAMAAEALWKYAQLPNSDYAVEAMSTYVQILNDLAVVNVHESPVTGVIEHSFIVLASTNESRLSREALAMIADSKMQVVSAATEMVEETYVPKKALVKGVLSAAIAHLAKEDRTLLPLAENVIKVSFTTTEEDDRASFVPWIVQASVDVSYLGGVIDTREIRKLRIHTLASQIKDETIPDALGGFSLKTIAGPVVDARGIRMLPMLAILLPETAFTSPGERSSSLQSMLLTARYTSQLTTTPERANRFINPTNAVGGVRNATWDTTMKPEATAMALIGITEAIEAIYRVANQ